MELLLLVVGLVTAVFLSQVIYNVFFSPLRSIPGPFLARFTRLWELYSVRQRLSHMEFVHQHGKHGPVVRIAPNRFSFSGPEDVKKIYALGGKFPKSEYYEPSGNPHRRNIFSVQDMADHADRRRKVASLYSMSTMVAYESAVDRMTAVCLKKLGQIGVEKRFVSVPDFMQYYAFDVIGEITLDENFGMMEKEGDDTGFISAIHSSLIYHANLGLLPDVHRWLVKVIDFLQIKNSGGSLEKLLVRKVTQHSNDGLKGKQNPRSEPFIAKVLQQEYAQKLTRTNVFDACGANIAAGSDTTGISLGAALYYLYKNPARLAKLRQEIDGGHAAGQVSDPVTFQESQRMPYLQAVIKEALRLHPAVGTILARSVPEGGVHLAEQYFPGGTQVGANAWVLHYDPQIYGPDPYSFRPERWLDDDGSKALKESMFFPFGAGSRACIGKNISLLEMSKVIPQIVREYDLEFEHPDQSWEVFCSWFVWPEYKCRVHHRALAV